MLTWSIQIHSFAVLRHSSNVRLPSARNDYGDTNELVTKVFLSPLNEDEKEKVNVNLIPEVDSFTLTAIGFTLIAFNFFVFANMGDFGVGVRTKYNYVTRIF
jgi:hypothetical protein